MYKNKNTFLRKCVKQKKKNTYTNVKKLAKKICIKEKYFL